MELLLLCHIIFGSSLLASSMFGLFVEQLRSNKLFAVNATTTAISGLALLPSSTSITTACVRLSVLSLAATSLHFYSTKRFSSVKIK